MDADIIKKYIYYKDSLYPKIKAEIQHISFQVLSCTDLAGSGGAGTVLPVAGQHVGRLVDQDLPHIL